MIEKLFALVVVVACVLLLVRQFIGERRRYRLDAMVYRMTSGLRRFWQRFQSHRHAGSAERTSRQASRMADNAIERARKASAREAAARRREVSREGNVYTPKSFGDARDPKRDSKRDTLH